jgi:hypothetical protein
MLTPYFERTSWCSRCRRETIQWRDRPGLPRSPWRHSPLTILRLAIRTVGHPWRCRDCGGNPSWL